MFLFLRLLPKLLMILFNVILVTVSVTRGDLGKYYPSQCGTGMVGHAACICTHDFKVPLCGVPRYCFFFSSFF